MPTKKEVANLVELLVQRFGIATTPRINDQLSSVGTSVLTLVRQTPARVAFSVYNLSINNIYIGPFNNVSSSKGIRLGASGGSAAVIPDEDFNLCSDEWFVIADGAASAILVIELLALDDPSAAAGRGDELTV